MNTPSKEITIHTSRTIMFSELSRIMDFSADDSLYLNALENNVSNKSTKSNLEKTNKYLKTLYEFDITKSDFRGFTSYWKIAAEVEKPILALLYALGRDFLLKESAETVFNTPYGEKVKVESVEELLDSYHPNRFTPKTRQSVAQNLLSSWKQAGYITGKVKNIRTKVEQSYHTIAFAMLLAYLNGDRGDLILQSKWVKALDLSEAKVRELAVEAAQRDLLQYQYAGAVTTISFEKFLTKLNS